MGLFESAGSAPQNQGGVLQPRPVPVAPPASKRQLQPETEAAPRTSLMPEARTRAKAPARKPASKAKTAAKGTSGLVPKGDVRLTANIRQDLHLKLKIASAYRRTTIGEIIEELIEHYV